METLSKIFFGLIFCFSLLANADHPNEGKLKISQLLAEVEKNNLEIKQAREAFAASQSQLSSQYGLFAPEVTLEGGPLATQFDTEKSSGTALYGQLKWNLYNGGTDSSQLQYFKNEKSIQEKRLLATQNRIKNKVSEVYYELLFLLESISLKQKAIEQNTQQMKIAKAKLKSGLTTSSDLIEFELREATLQSDIVMLSQQLDTKSRELNFILSKKSQDSHETVQGHLIREKIQFDRSLLLDKLQTSNSELLQAQSDLNMNLREEDSAFSQMMPKLNVEARYGKLTNEERVFNENNNYSLFLHFQVPLFSGLKDYHSLKSSKSKVVSSQIGFELRKAQIVAELDSKLNEIKTLNARLDLEEKNLELSEKYYEYTLVEYKRGTKNSPDMVGASERILEVRIRNLEYRRDLLLAKLRVQDLIGE